MRKILILAAIVSVLAGCGKQNTYQPDADNAKTLQAQAKTQALKPAEGKYSGTMKLLNTQGQVDFLVTLELHITPDNVHSSESTDPTDTAEVPKLQGAMVFPAIRNLGDAAYETLPDLMRATGGSDHIAFTYGDYVPSTQVLNLPFTVPNYSGGDYGAVIGVLSSITTTKSGVSTTVWTYEGTWYSDSSQAVGHFILKRTEVSS